MPLGERRVIGERGIRLARGTRCGEDAIETEALRSLCAPEAVSRHRLGDPATLAAPFDRVGKRQDGYRGVAGRKSIEHPIDDRRRGQWPGGIVDQDGIGPGGC